jgi:hypothetical protein
MIKIYFTIFKYLVSSTNNNYKNKKKKYLKNHLKKSAPPSRKNYQKNCIEHEYFIFKSLSFWQF